MVSGASLRPVTRYEPVEAMLDRPSSYDGRHQPTARLGIYCSFVEEEVAAAVRQLLAEMERP